jgi:hypothetical protein
MGIFTHLIKKKPRVRIKRKKTVTFHQLEGGFLVKSRLIPWLRVGKSCVWLGSIANSKSTRQINDWFQRRKNRRTRRLDGNLTGKAGNKVQALAIRALHEWLDYIPPGDSVVFRCEAAMPEKQFRVWKKWILRHNHYLQPDIDEELKSFFFYKPRDIE